MGRSRISWVGSENTIEELDCPRFVLLACLQDAHQLCEAFSRHLSGLPWRHLQPETRSVAGAEVAVQGSGSTPVTLDSAAELATLQRITHEYQVGQEGRWHCYAAKIHLR
jgi:hypothetical protein